jgi:hypothetical protein
MSIKKPDEIISHVQAVVNNWLDYAEKTGVNGDLRDGIQNTLLKL